MPVQNQAEVLHEKAETACSLEAALAPLSEPATPAYNAARLTVPSLVINKLPVVAELLS
jgi:hypothetical protein